jgi:hypothetical protein
MSPWRKQALSSQLLVKGMGRWRARDEPRCWSTSEEDLVWNPEGNRTSRSQVGGGKARKGGRLNWSVSVLELVQYQVGWYERGKRQAWT